MIYTECVSIIGFSTELSQINETLSIYYALKTNIL